VCGRFEEDYFNMHNFILCNMFVYLYKLSQGDRMDW
jgi:hypothetical protein